MKEKTFIRWLGSEDRSRQVVALDEGKIINAEIDIKLNWQRYKEEYLQKVKG